jgi:hypothetical protein
VALRAWALVAFLSLAAAQGYQVGGYGLGGTATLYLGLYGVWPWEGGHLTLSLAPYLRLPGGEAGLSVERLSLSLFEGPWGLEVGRFPLSLGVGRLFPFALGEPSPGLGEVGVLGGGLTWYGERGAVRAGLAWKEGGFLEVRLPPFRAYAYSRGLGLVAEALWEGVVLYGEGRLASAQAQGLLGATWRFEEALFTLEARYPFALGLGVEAGLEGLGVAVRALYEGGLRVGLGLLGEGWRGWVGFGPGELSWGFAVSRDF